MKSRIYEGVVQHDRRAPRRHRFRYRMYQLYIDLDELPELFDPYRFWSADGEALARFDRRDHFGSELVPLKNAVQQLIKLQTGATSNGPVRLLTHPRYFGYGFNPVSFYYCFDASDSNVEFIVAEVNNTPWGEQHCYVLDCRAQPACTQAHDQHGEAPTPGNRDHWTFEFDKCMHVSPFMAMTQRYHWHLWAPGERLRVHMENFEGGERLFSASMVLRERPINSYTLARALLRFPLMTLQVITAIHWQAFRLWLKGVPVHDHPKHLDAAEAEQ